MGEIGTYFENFLTKESIFKEKIALQQTFIPDRILHRDEQTSALAAILAPCLKFEKPSNIFLYGKTGTGKTVTVNHTISELIKVSSKTNNNIKSIYINCKMKNIADTEYRFIAHLTRELGQDIPPTGLPTDEVYRIFFSVIDKEKRMILLVIDEIDNLVKKAGDGILYSLTRMNQELKNSIVTIVGITNEWNFANDIDPRVRSSLSEEEIVFPPYDALQIKDILLERANKAFKEGVVEEGVIEKCAAYAAREHGDARRALELLRVAAELAERRNSIKLNISFLDDAEQTIEKDKLKEIVSTQPKQFQVVLYSIVLLHETNKEKVIYTGEVYDLYKDLCIKSGLRSLTQRRVSDVISELDMLGIINTTLISKGRQGRTRQITIELGETSFDTIKKLLNDSLRIE